MKKLLFLLFVLIGFNSQANVMVSWFYADTADGSVNGAGSPDGYISLYWNGLPSTPAGVGFGQYTASLVSGSWHFSLGYNSGTYNIDYIGGVGWQEDKIDQFFHPGCPDQPRSTLKGVVHAEALVALGESYDPPLAAVEKIGVGRVCQYTGDFNRAVQIV